MSYHKKNISSSELFISFLSSSPFSCWCVWCPAQAAGRRSLPEGWRSYRSWLRMSWLTKPTTSSVWTLTLCSTPAGGPSHWVTWSLWSILVSKQNWPSSTKITFVNVAPCVQFVPSYLCVCRLLQSWSRRVRLRAEACIQSLHFSWRGGLLLLWGGLWRLPEGSAPARQNLLRELQGWRQGKHRGYLAGGESPEQVSRRESSEQVMTLTVFSDDLLNTSCPFVFRYMWVNKPSKLLSPEYLWQDFAAREPEIQIVRFSGIVKNYADIRPNKWESWLKWPVFLHSVTEDSLLFGFNWPHSCYRLYWHVFMSICIVKCFFLFLLFHIIWFVYFLFI